MSGECPFQSRILDNEARCIIGMILKPHELEDSIIGFGSWFCSWLNQEKQCPIMKRINEWDPLP